MKDFSCSTAITQEGKYHAQSPFPVGGPDSAFQATLYLIHGTVEVHVVNVQPKLLEWQTQGVEKVAVNDHLAIEAHLVMKPILHALNEGGIAYQTHVNLGDVAETLSALAEELGCDLIVMGACGLGGLGSVTRKVIHLSKIPVACVRGEPSGR